MYIYQVIGHHEIPYMDYPLLFVCSDIWDFYRIQNRVMQEAA